jgi:hypothetical protein
MVLKKIRPSLFREGLIFFTSSAAFANCYISEFLAIASFLFLPMLVLLLLVSEIVTTVFGGRTISFFIS